MALLRSTVAKAPYSKITRTIFEMYKIDDHYLLKALDTAESELFNHPMEKANGVFDNVFPYYKHKLGLARTHYAAKKQAMVACENEDLSLALKYMSDVSVDKMYVPKSTKRQLLKVTETPQLLNRIEVVDRNGGWRRGNIVQITGDSGTMKTTCSLWIA